MSDKILVEYQAVPVGFDKVGVAVNTVTTETKELQTQIKATFSDKSLDDATNKMNAYGDAVEESTNKQKSLTAQLKELKKQIGISTDPKEIKRLTAAAAELDDKIGDINKEVKKLGSDTRTFDTLITGARGVAAAFSVATGLAASFGDENKDLQKTLLKVQGAMAALQGVQELAAIATERGGLATKAATIAQGAYAFVVGESTGALKLFRIALAATGVGLFIIAIGTLVANWDKLKKAVTENSEGFQKFTESMKFLSPLLYIVIKPIQYIIQHLKDLKEVIAGVWDVAALVFGNIGETMNDIMTGQFGKIAAIWKDFGKKSQEAFEAGRKEVRDKDAFDKEFEAAEFAVKLAEVSGKNIYQAKKKYLELEIKDLKSRNEDTRLKEAELTKLIEDEVEKREKWLKEHTRDHKQKPIDNVSAITSVDPLVTKDVVDMNKKNADQMWKDLKEFAYDKAIAEQEKFKQAMFKAGVDLSNSISKLTSSIFAQQSQEITDRQTTEQSALEKKKAQELKTVGDNAEKKHAIEERYAKRKADMEKRFAIEKAKLERQQAISNKIFALFNIGINMAQAIMKTGADMGYPAAIPFVALAAATAAIETAAILAQPLPSIPKFAKGGSVLAGGRNSDGHLIGRSHRDGGILIEAQGGEYIWDRETTQKHSDIIKAAHENRIEDLVLHKYVVPLMKAKENRESESYDDWKLRATIKHGQQLEKQNAKYIVEGISTNMKDNLYFANRYK